MSWLQFIRSELSLCIKITWKIPMPCKSWLEVGPRHYVFTSSEYCLTDLFCVTSVCQLPGAGCLREACGLERGGSFQLEVTVKKLTAGGCLLTVLLGSAASSLMKEFLSNTSLCYHSYSIAPLVCRWKGTGLMCTWPSSGGYFSHCLCLEIICSPRFLIN